jgi:hypothetical protein
VYPTITTILRGKQYSCDESSRTRRTRKENIQSFEVGAFNVKQFEFRVKHEKRRQQATATACDVPTDCRTMANARRGNITRDVRQKRERSAHIRISFK